MSGGVDSSVAAAVLKEEGHEVAGAFIRTWAEDECALSVTNGCCGLRGLEDAKKIASTLRIPFWSFDFSKEFREHVVDYFAAEYLKARTPNPCIVCNNEIKFGLFFERAQKLGFDGIATGHYARIENESSSGLFYISEARDRKKDQSYVLFGLGQGILPRLYLPLGTWLKSEVRIKASELDLAVKDKRESQEICFIPDQDYGRFLEEKYPGDKIRDLKQSLPEGVVRTREGKVLGRHDGYYHFTIGQRRGLKIAHKERLYVLEINSQKNEIIVGTKEDTFAGRFEVAGVRWTLPPASCELTAEVKVRYLHQKTEARIRIKGADAAEVIFDRPQEAVTPGQAAVFYRDGKILGGGWIRSALALSLD